MGSIRGPPIGPAARYGGLVSNAKSAPNAEKFEGILRFQFANQWRNRLDRGDKWHGLGNLRTDVHLDAADDDVRHFCSAFVNGWGASERNAEFVFALAGRDILVRRRRDIGTHPQRDSRALILSGGDLIDVIELSLAFDIEGINTLLEGIFDLFARFPDAGESAFRGVAAGPDNAIEFATGDDIEPGTCLPQQAKNGAI